MNQIKKQMKRHTLVQILFVVIIIFVSLFTVQQVLQQRSTIRNMQADIDKLNVELQKKEKEKEELIHDYKNKTSLDFIEKVAREELGMIKSNEIVVKDSAEKQDQSDFNKGQDKQDENLSKGKSKVEQDKKDKKDNKDHKE